LRHGLRIYGDSVLGNPSIANYAHAGNTCCAGVVLCGAGIPACGCSELNGETEENATDMNVRATKTQRELQLSRWTKAMLLVS
jgi:hypothetical protein